jgi:hypothetical protein
MSWILYFESRHSYDVVLVKLSQRLLRIGSHATDSDYDLEISLAGALWLFGRALNSAPEGV